MGKSVAIIGAGASGLACAIKLKQNNPSLEVFILERLNTVGKKILATGNGRCNFSNTHAKHYKDVVDFFNSIGLKERVDGEGRIYPYSNRADTVVEILLDECNSLGIKIITDCEVKNISFDFKIQTQNSDYNANYIVICTGGKAQSKLGSNGSGYTLLKNLGHGITPLCPALVQLTSSSKYPRILKGQRIKGSIKILLDGKCENEDFGEILFTDYGLSGIVCMNVSETVARNFESPNPKKCTAIIDLASDISKDELTKHIEKFGSLDGILGRRISSLLTKQADGNKEKIVSYAKNWQLIITGTKGYDFAQITSGGASVDEFDNFESVKHKNLYACGEVLDRQFECGGFNLNFAFYSGITVANNISNKINKE